MVLENSGVLVTESVDQWAFKLLFLTRRIANVSPSQAFSSGRVKSWRSLRELSSSCRFWCSNRLVSRINIMSKQKLEEIQTITIVVHFYPHTNLFSKIYAFWGLYSRCPSHIGVVLLLFIAVFNSPSLSPFHRYLPLHRCYRHWRRFIVRIHVGDS